MFYGCAADVSVMAVDERLPFSGGFSKHAQFLVV